MDSKASAAFALHRFGLGPRAGSIAAIASDPRGALKAEVGHPDAGLVADRTLPTAAQSSMAAFNFRQARQAERIAMRKAEEERRAAGGADTSMAMEGGAEGASPAARAQPQPPDVAQQNYNREIQARVDAATTAELGFVERLVWFWSNHFCVSADVVPNMAGGYEREAIRANVLGRFSDMLQAVVSHPAMLVYLDNSRSIGPKSVAGLIGSRGLNENLAREILELHTLGVRSVYTQDDVTAFAKVLTGWTLLPAQTNPQHGSEFVFNPRLHEPGPQTVLGRTYEDTGFEQGRAVLAALARHPATALHVARKLARHFAADDPPPALVERLRGRFLDTDGDLKELALTLIDAPEVWETPRTKLKRPSEWLIAVWRAIGAAPEPRRIAQTQNYLGERLWRPPAPKGFADEQAAWLDGVPQRLDIANRIAERVGQRIDANELVEQTLGPLASAETHQTIARAESRQQALTLALMAPEFHRR